MYTHYGKINFRFGGRHIGLPETVEDVRKVSSGSPNIFGKSHERAPLNSLRFGSGSEKMGLAGAVILPPGKACFYIQSRWAKTHPL
jgi:hypothetical protein